jgi:hypothetical protein
MEYFFGSERNDKGLCATPGCKGVPVHLFIYKYCEKCFDTIAREMEAGLTPMIDRLEKRSPQPAAPAA